MAELLVPADDEVALVRELTERLDGVHVGTRVPNPLLREFVRVVSLGGIQRDHVTDSFSDAIEGFAETEGRARYLCAAAVAHAQAAARAGWMGGVPCSRVVVASLPSNLPMPSVPDRFRFTATIAPDLRRVGA